MDLVIRIDGVKQGNMGMLDLESLLAYQFPWLCSGVSQKRLSNHLNRRLFQLEFR
jgi:hypothetical protein